MLPFTKEDDKRLQDITKFKQEFGIWDNWTGARYQREYNPNPDKDTDLKAICRYNPATYTWEAR